MQRRLDAEPSADRFTDGRRGIDGPHREVQARDGHAGHAGHNGHQLVERRHFTAGEDVGAIRRTRMRAAQPEPVHEIVNVRKMVIDVACTERDPAASGDTAEQLQQPAIARTVNAGRAHDGQLDPAAGGRFARHLLPFQLGLLVDVAGTERCILIRRRMPHVAMHADRAAMNDARDAARRRRLDHLARGVPVDTPIGLARQAGLPIDRGHVVDDIDPCGRGDERGSITNVADNEFDAGRGERLSAPRRIPHQGPDRIAALGQLPRQMAAGEPGCARD